MAVTVYSYQIGGLTVFGVAPVFRPIPPPFVALGYFHGCPTPQLPVCRVPMPILSRVAARCCVSPPFIPMVAKPWYVAPPLRYIYPPVVVWRR